MIRSVIELNVLGAMMCVKAAIPRMSAKARRAGGAIVMLSSVARHSSAGEYVWYAASKGAVDLDDHRPRQELAGDGIPRQRRRAGIIATDIHPPGRLERLAPLTPVGAQAPPTRSPNPCCSCSPTVVPHTGTVLRVSGGADRPITFTPCTLPPKPYDSARRRAIRVSI